MAGIKLKLVCIALCCLANSSLFAGASSEWSYQGPSGPDHWSSSAADCGATRQSPIDIESNAAFPDPALSALEFLGYEQDLSGASYINNGHTVQLNLPSDKSYKLMGVNGNNYTALQLHFHWVTKASSDAAANAGSEHTINGQHYDAEMHIVHIKEGYTSAADVAHMVDGLAVVGVFLQSDPNAAPNLEFQSLLKATQEAKYSGGTSELSETTATLSSLLPLSGSYYRYFGSLTTPPCTQDVVWTVYQKPKILGPKQMLYLQSLKSDKEPADESVENEEEHPLGDNYRPTQPLNGRIVSSYNDIALRTARVGEKHGWSYKHGAPEHWGGDIEECSATSQSPINFDTSSIEASSDVEAVTLSNSYQDATTGTLSNNGHTIKYAITSPTLRTFQDSGHGDYQALQLHFHWGTASVNGKDVSVSGGSEHTVNNEHFPIEMHIVHRKMNDLDPATNDDDYAVLGSMFSIADTEEDVNQEANAALKTLTQHFHKIQYKDQATDVDAGPILHNLMPSIKSYYRYMGSLTTPPCTQAVLWSVWTKPVVIPKETFLAFQSIFLMAEDGVEHIGFQEASSPSEYIVSGNYRPVQELNGRTVVMFDEEAAPPSTDSDDSSSKGCPTVVPPGSPEETNATMIVIYVVIALVVLAIVFAAIVYMRKRKQSEDSKDKALYKQGSEVEA